MLIRNWQKFYFLDKAIVINEKMVRFDGNLSWKQYDPSKSAKSVNDPSKSVKHLEGIKNFLCCDAPTRYSFTLEICCGKKL